MNEMIEAAQDRQKQLDRHIAQREAEITEFRAEAEKLATFIGLVEELFVEQETARQPAPAAAPPPQPQNAAPQSVQHQKPQDAPQAAPQAHAAQQDPQRTMPARQPRTA